MDNQNQSNKTDFIFMNKWVVLKKSIQVCQVKKNQPLTGKSSSDKNYEHVTRYCDAFSMKNMKHHNSHLPWKVLLLTDVLQKS